MPSQKIIVDHNIADGNYGIFALTVETKNKELPNIVKSKNVKLVDSHYSSISQDSTKIQYSEIPEKPDGTK